MAEENTVSAGKKPPMRDENIVLVGNKPPMSYVLAVVTQFHNGASDVHLKARGRAISRAVDVAEIVRNKFMTDLKVSAIDISTESMQGDQGEHINVSAIDIALNK